MVDLLQSDRIVPRNTIEEFVRLALPAGTGTDTHRTSLLEEMLQYWNGQNAQRKKEGRTLLQDSTPLLISRGYDAVMPEDQLAHYLPEEKILINKEVFRTKLHGVDWSQLDPQKERTLVEDLKSDSIGLSQEDVILYYNLIKVNMLAKLSQTRTGQDGTAPLSYQSKQKQQAPSITGETLYRLGEKALGVQPDQIVKINGGKSIDQGVLFSVLSESLKRRRVNLPVYAHYLGMYTDKYIRTVIDFVNMAIQARGEDPKDYQAYHLLYLVLGGTDPKLLESLELATPLTAYLTDKIGRVRSFYYVAFMFIHTFVYVLCAQVTEIALKYQNSSPDQQAKLKKLYASPERYGMLLTNTTNVANRRVEGHKVESREVQNLFRRFIASRKDLLSPNDLFETPVIF